MSVNKKGLRDALGASLVSIGKKNEKIVVLDADVGHPTRSYLFENAFPSRYIQSGIAEQNMVGVAAGLASCGLVPIVVCFAAFLVRRCFDQIYNSISFPGLNVKLIGCYSGFTTYGTGASHQTFDDVSIMRTLPNITIINVGDPSEVEQVMFDISEREGPFYVRIGRIDSIEPLYSKNDRFTIGNVLQVEEGKDAAILATGIMTAICKKAVHLLKKDGIQISLYHVPTLKPLSEETIAEILKQHHIVFTVEDQNSTGGLGGSINSLSIKMGLKKEIVNIGIDERFGKCGSLEELFDYFGISDVHIYKRVKNILKENKV